MARRETVLAPILSLVGRQKSQMVHWKNCFKQQLSEYAVTEMILYNCGQNPLCCGYLVYLSIGYVVPCQNL